ncbi:two-component system response regulator, partial [Prochlorothrix hollandica]|uniref:two-component system response regulator n=1 Tax=Prochlorothrix hollandica TaxID=1223 RepID=UPI0033401C69
MTGSPGEVAETLRPEPADILIVDDTPANLRLLSSLLSNQGYRVRKAISGKMAQLALDRLLPDLILLDVRMPEMNGYELCQILKQNPKTQAIPVIFLSALGEPLNKVQAFQAGGVDYITKPFDSEEVLMRIRTHLMLQAAQRQIKQINGILEERVQERTQQLEAANFQLRKLAHYDCLTGLPNRTQFMDLLRQAQRQLAQKVMNFTLGTVTAEETATLECYSSPLVDLAVPAGHQFVVFFLDCDRFKIINDSLGHLAGDELLTLVAQRLLNTLRSQDVLARLGGDEFAILLSSIANMDEVTIVANRIIKAMEQPFQLQNHEVFIGISIGIVQVTDRYDQPEEILRDADMAMYEAKHRGKGCYHVFSSSMHESALHRLCQENDLRRAIDHNELVMFYQPIVDLKTCKMTGFEALVRWQHPQHGMVPPIEFIAMAEEMGLIVPMGWWIFEQACGQLRQWQDQGITRDLTLNLNLSAYQLRYPHLLERIDQAIK